MTKPVLLNIYYNQVNIKLMVEVFKTFNGFAPPIKENSLLFCENTYSICDFQIISNDTKKTVEV